MFKTNCLFALLSIATVALHAQTPNIKIPITHESNVYSFSQHHYIKEAPQITSVRVVSVTSRAGTELIGEGQMGTINHHSGAVAIVTLEVGYANYVTAIMNGNHLADSDRRPLCADGQGSPRECHGGESAVAFMRAWTIKNFTNGVFTYQATSTNPPYRKESTRLLIN